MVRVYPLQGKIDSENRAVVSDQDILDFLQVNKNLEFMLGHELRIFKGKYSCLPDAKYISFFRNPIDRYLSHFQQWSTYGNENESLERRINDENENNHMVKFFADDEDLEKAKRIVSENLDFVGIVEEFDESLLLMRQILNLGEDFDIRYTIRNSSVAKPGRNYLDKEYSSLPSNQKEKIIQNNKLDMKLYNFVRDEMFQKQKDQYQGSLEKDVIDLQRALRGFRFNPLRLAYYRCERLLRYKIRLVPQFSSCSCSRIKSRHRDKCSFCYDRFG
jgi:hypothetical protein